MNSYIFNFNQLKELKFFCLHFLKFILFISIFCYTNSLSVFAQSAELKAQNEPFQNISLSHGLPNSIISKLENEKILNLAEFRRILVKNPNKLKFLEPCELKKVKKASILSLVSDNDKISEKLIDENFGSIHDLKEWSVNDIIEKADVDTQIANSIKNKIKGLNNLISLSRFQLRANSRNPNSYIKPGTYMHPGQLNIDFSDETETECLTCDENNNIFSPAVYLLYLLDFLKKSSHENMDEQSEINERFKQKFDSVLTIQDIKYSDSYVRFANEILENHIADYYPEISKPNYDSQNKSSLKSDLYKKWENINNLPNKYLLVDLFYEYINEFELTRAGAHLIYQSANEDFIEQFERKRGLAPGTIQFFNLDTTEINYLQLISIKDLFLKFLEKKYEPIVEQEIVVGIADETRADFIPYFKEYISSTSKDILYSRLPELDLELKGDQFEEALNMLKGEARACVQLGIECPENHLCDSIPANPILELYRKYAKKYYRRGQSINTFALNRFLALKNRISRERFLELKSSINVDTSFAETDSARIQKESNDYAIDRIYSEEEFEIQLNDLAKYLWQLKNRPGSFAKQTFESEVKSRSKADWEVRVSEVELSLQTKLRENLLSQLFDVTGEENKTLKQFTDSLANALFMDLSVNEQHKTTPLSFAINRVHTYIQAIRMELIPDRFIQFDENLWEYLRSYGIWHAAIMVQLYPDNFFMEDLITEKSPEFKSLIEGIEQGENVDKLVQEYENTLNLYKKSYFTKLHKVGNRMILFRYDNYDGYYSFIDDNNKYTYWKKIEGPFRILDISFSPSSTSRSNNEYITFFSWQLSATSNNANISPKHTLYYTVATIKNDSISFQDPTLIETSIHTYAGLRNAYKKYFVKSYGLNGSINVDELNSLHAFTTSCGYKYLNQPIPLPYSHRIVWKFQIQSDGTPALNGIVPENLCLTPRDEYDYFHSFYENLELSKKDNHGLVTLWNFPLTKKSILLGGRMDKEFPYHAPYPESPKEYRDLILSNNRLPDDIYTNDLSIGTYNWWGLLISHIYCKRDDINRLYEIAIGLDNKISHIYTLKEGISIDQIIDIKYFNKWYYFGKYKEKFGYYDLDAIKNNKDFLVLEMPEFSFKDKNKISLKSGQKYHELITKYLNEYYLYMPLYVANYLSENHQYEKAYDYLCRIYDPLHPPNESDIIYPGFLQELPSSSYINAFLKDPFDPISIMNVYKNKYVELVLLKHAENLIDWGDALFIQDSPESVNRARELYELAAKILGTDTWLKDECEEDWLVLNKKLEEEGLDIENILIKPKTEEVNLANVFYESNIKNQPFDILQKIAWQQYLESITSGSTKAKNTMANYIEKDKKEATIEEEDYTLQLVDELLSDYGNIDVPAGLDLKPFCIPLNPMLNSLRFRVESNLEKIKTNRNFAGMQRDLQFYATPVDATKIIQNAGNLDLNTVNFNSPPPIYRYSFLYERAKYLNSLAKQLENQMLSALKDEEQAKYTLFRAKQDINLEKANVSLQNLRLNEAFNSKFSAEAQKNKMNYTKMHYNNLIEDGLISWEHAGIVSQSAAIGFHYSAAVASGVAAGQDFLKSVFTAGLLGNSGEQLASSFSSLAAASQATSSLMQTKASYARREQDWKFQRNLAKQEMVIAQIGIDIAQDRINIVNQEKNISTLRLQHANDNVEFLNSQFGNTQLYAWMRKNLKSLYKQQLNMAIATAKTAQKALEFERQTSLDFIGYNYWIDEKKGLLGSEQLESDLERMEDYRIGSDVRKKEIEKTLSLSSIAPVEFNEFRKNGVLNFETQMAWFDRDFPGHYLRMIRDVNVTVLGLIPPNEGIHATLSNDGISYIVTNVSSIEPSVVYRLPESIALSKYINANGLFELRPDDKMLFPFEGSGVTTTWTLDMPNGANRFDYNSIADILFTIRYTALDDWGYKNKVLEKYKWDEEGYITTSSNRYFSIRNEFPDQWYYFQNPIEGINEDSTFFDPINSRPDSLENIELPLKWFSMILDIGKFDFVPNEEDLKINKITVAVKLTDKLKYEDYRIPFIIQFYPNKGYKSGADTLDIDHSFEVSNIFYGKKPYGKWVIKLDTTRLDIPNTEIFTPIISETNGTIQDVSWLEDILLVIEYKAKAHYSR